MNYCDLIVHVDANPSSNDRLEAAIALAVDHGAHLTGLYVDRGLLIPGPLEAPIPTELIDRLETERLERITLVQMHFNEATGHAGLAAEWRCASGEVVPTITVHGRYADLVIVGQDEPDQDIPMPTGIADSVALACGRPVLVIPYIGANPPLGRRILVAWNGGREAVRAVNDALPLMRNADQVEVLTMNPDSAKAGALPGADIALHLARHDVPVEAKALVAHDIDVGAMLLSHAADMGADLIVMGAYGHSRFREIVLGGATRELLGAMTVPVLFSH